MAFIYLDAASTTPPFKEVLDIVYSVSKTKWFNSSSTHFGGISSSEILEKSRFDIARKFKTQHHNVVFTSGASESIMIALNNLSLNFKPQSICTSTVEHQSTYIALERLKRVGWNIDYWPVSINGIVDFSRIEQNLKKETKILSLIWGQSEIGSIQPINKIGSICKQLGIIFHVDGTQILSNGIFDWNKINCDLLSLSAHKFGGPKGIGLLLLKDNVLDLLQDINISPLHENQIRQGTQSVALIAGMSKALENRNDYITLKENNIIFPNNIAKKVINKVKEELSAIKAITFTGDPINRLPNNLSFIIKNYKNKPISSDKIINYFSDRDIAISSGSACSSFSIDTSVLKSIQIDNIFRKSHLRISSGYWNRLSDTDNIANLLNNCIELFD